MCVIDVCTLLNFQIHLLMCKLCYVGVTLNLWRLKILTTTWLWCGVFFLF